MLCRIFFADTRGRVSLHCDRSGFRICIGFCVSPRTTAGTMRASSPTMRVGWFFVFALGAAFRSTIPPGRRGRRSLHRRHKLRILRFGMYAKAHSLRCSSSPDRTRFAGLRSGITKDGGRENGRSAVYRRVLPRRGDSRIARAVKHCNFDPPSANTQKQKPPFSAPRASLRSVALSHTRLRAGV